MLKKIIIIVFSIVTIMVGYGCYILNYIPHRSYTSSDFGIEVIKSTKDADGDGIDDYTDILEGAKQVAVDNPYYHSGYYEGGYPPENEGVCTDVIWRSLANAGYDLKTLIDTDISEHLERYPRVERNPDPNIDFRRVPNQLAFFEANTESLTTDLSQIAEWMPGDIVVFANNHIGIISDKRNKNGIPFLIHSGGNYQYRLEEDELMLLEKVKGISGHFRLNFQQ